MSGIYAWGQITEVTTLEELYCRQVAARAEGAAWMEFNVSPGDDPTVNGGRYAGWYQGPDLGMEENERRSARIAARLEGP